MKFDHAWIFAGQPRDETPAPTPGKRTPVLPRLPACRALFRQGKCIFRAMLAVFRTGRRQHLAFGEHALGPRVPHLAAQPKRHNLRLSCPPPSHKARLGTGQRLSHGARRLACGGLIGPPHPNRLATACWGASEIGLDFSNGGLRPKTGECALGPLAGAMPPIRWRDHERLPISDAAEVSRRACAGRHRSIRVPDDVLTIREERKRVHHG